MHNLRTTTCLISIAISLHTTPVFAQDAIFELDPIIVWSNFWEERARDTAASVSAVDGEDLSGQPAAELDTVANKTSNVLFQRANSNDRLIVRGLSAFDNALTDPVGYQVNGVSLPLGTIQLPQFFAADQVALLKGPQGTTAGRNASAGLLTFDTIAPGGLGGWRASFGLTGSDAGAESNGAHASLIFSDWISDSTALTFGLEAMRDSGVISDPLGDDDGGALERINGVFGMAWNLGNGAEIEFNTVIELEDKGKEQFRYADGFLATDRFVTSYSDPSDEHRRSSVTSLQYTQDLGGVELTAITGFTTFDRDFRLDFDSSQLTLGTTELDLRDRMFSQEIRLASIEGDGPLQWSVGAHFFEQTTDFEFSLGALSTNRETEAKQTGFALFGFAEYEVSHRLSLGAGLRLDAIESSATQVLTNGFGTSSYDGESSSVVALPKFTASYRLSDDALFYGSIARGYMPAGYNYAFASDAASLTYDAEYSWAAEVGYKHSFAGGANLNVAAFHTQVQDKQITETIPGAAQRISNAAEVESYGLEVEFNAPISSNWTLGLNAGLQRARATSFETTIFDASTFSLVPVDYSGNALPFAPDVTYGLSLGYVGGNGWSGEIALSGSGRYFFDAGNTLEQDGITNLSLKVNREIGQGVLTLWAENLLDEEFFTIAANTPRGVVVEDGQPRRFGLNYTMEF